MIQPRVGIRFSSRQEQDIRKPCWLNFSCTRSFIISCDLKNSLLLGKERECVPSGSMLMQIPHGEVCAWTLSLSSVFPLPIYSKWKSNWDLCPCASFLDVNEKFSQQDWSQKEQREPRKVREGSWLCWVCCSNPKYVYGQGSVALVISLESIPWWSCTWECLCSN